MRIYDVKPIVRLKKLRDYQQRINAKVAEFIQDRRAGNRAQIYAPTGSGKTECFAHTVYDLPRLMRADGRKLAVLIIHPRLALSADQQHRFHDMFGSTFQYVGLHSGGDLLGQDGEREANTLDFNVVRKDIQHSPHPIHITFTSYDSLHKVGNYPFDLIIGDEAHNLTEEQYTETLARLGGKKMLFYTATPIVADLEDEPGGGMNAKRLFGEVIVTVAPRELIEKGYIVPPHVDFLEVQTKKPADGVDTTSIVAYAYEHQRRVLMEHGMPFTQMLVTSRGYEDHKKFESELGYFWKQVDEDVPLYVIEADETRKNGQKYKDRYDTLEEIKESGRSAIIMHYDTVAEGIDISSLTSACILRTMPKAKILQTIGRCGRPFWHDLDKRGEPIDPQRRKKPSSVIIFPSKNGEHIGGIDKGKIAGAFRAGGYGDLQQYLQEDE